MDEPTKQWCRVCGTRLSQWTHSHAHNDGICHDLPVIRVPISKQTYRLESKESRAAEIVIKRARNLRW